MVKAQHRIKQIKSCRVCESKNLFSVLNLGNLFVSKFYKNNKKPLKFPLEIMFCEKCTLLQLKHIIPKNILYANDYGYYSGVNKTMRNELRNIYKISANVCKLLDGDLVVDIGSNDATLLKCFPENILKLGFDPVVKFSKFYKFKNTYYIPEYFSYDKYRNLFPKKKAKLVTAIAVFYDLEEPNNFLQNINKVLDKKGVFVIQQNYLGSMLENCAFDNIVHEHVEYYSLTSLEYLLEKHGLEVFDVAMSKINGGSYRTLIAKKNVFRISDSVRKMKYLEKKMNLGEMRTYEKFAQNVRKRAKELHKHISEFTKKGQKIYLYGASTRGSTLLQYAGINTNFIKKAVERNTEKWGKIMSSVGIPIISEEQARRERPDYFLVLPWYFREEILKRERNFLKRKGKLIFPLPNLELVDSL